MGTDEAICLFGAGGHGRGVAAQIARFTGKAAVFTDDARIGADCWISANATVLQGVQICDHVTIGAGAVVTINIEATGKYVGIPVRLILYKGVGFDNQRIKI